MTNAEKYNEVFGFPPDKESCPTKSCDICPGHVEECLCNCKWWDEEYTEERPQAEDCEGCMYENISPDKYPCNDCKNNHKNYWRPKE